MFINFNCRSESTMANEDVINFEKLLSAFNITSALQKLPDIFASIGIDPKLIDKFEAFVKAHMDVHGLIWLNRHFTWLQIALMKTVIGLIIGVSILLAEAGAFKKHHVGLELDRKDELPPFPHGTSLLADPNRELSLNLNQMPRPSYNYNKGVLPTAHKASSLNGYNIYKKLPAPYKGKF